MRKWIITALAAFTLAGSPAVWAQEGAAGLGDSLYPNFGNGGYDVQHYDVNLQVDPESNHLEGIVTLTATATQPLSSFNLDFIGFEIASITVDDSTANWSRDGQELTVMNVVSVPEGETFTVEVIYSGSPELMESVALPVLTGWVNYGDGIYVLSEPDGAATFFPCNDHPLDKATYRLSVTVPKPYNVAMNGIVVDEIDNGDTVTTISDVNYPMATYLVTINIAQFNLVHEVGTNGVPIRNYFEQGIDARLHEAFARQDEMIGYFESLFGEYPFDVYGSVVVSAETGSALETQTLSIFGVDSLDANDILYSELVVAHELAHQWFGNSVSLADWRDIWLNEGWASYAEGLWIEHKRGDVSFRAWVREQLSISQGMRPPVNPLANDLFDGSVYVRGSMVLHALRELVGDETFFEIAREWASRYAYGNATTDDFLALISEIGGVGIADALEAWLYAPDIPPLEFRS